MIKDRFISVNISGNFFLLEQIQPIGIFEIVPIFLLHDKLMLLMGLLTRRAPEITGKSVCMHVCSYIISKNYISVVTCTFCEVVLLSIILLWRSDTQLSTVPTYRL